MTVFVLVDLAFARLATAFLVDVRQDVAEAVFVLVNQLVVVDVCVVYAVATVCVTVTVALTVTVTVVVLAGLVTVEVLVMVVVAGGVVLVVGVVGTALDEVVADEALQLPEGSMVLVSSVTAAVSAYKPPPLRVTPVVAVIEA